MILEKAIISEKLSHLISELKPSKPALKIFDAGVVTPPFGATAVATFGFELLGLIAKPGRLSITCSPGYTNIVVLSIRSLFLPVTYENLADSISAL